MACRRSSYLVVVLSFLLMTFWYTTWSPVLKIFNTTLMNFVVGYHPTRCHWIQTNASPCSFPGKDSPLSRLTFMSMDQYLSIILQISWSPDFFWPSSLGLTILRISAQKHVSRLDSYFYKHASPVTLRTLYTAHIRPHLEYAVPVCMGSTFLQRYWRIGVNSEVQY